MDNTKITNKFIPKTNSHTSSRISYIIKKINKNQKKNKKQIGIKTYKKKYYKNLLKKSTKRKTKLQVKSQSKSKSKSKAHSQSKSKSQRKSKTKSQRKSKSKSQRKSKSKTQVKSKTKSQRKSKTKKHIKRKATLQLKTPKIVNNSNKLDSKTININDILKNKIVIPDMIISNNKENKENKKNKETKENNNKTSSETVTNTNNLSTINQLPKKGNNNYKNTKDTKDTKNTKESKEYKDNYIIAIPSYNRPELIQVKTLAVLHKHNINSKLINIFVSDRDQYNLYKSKVPDFLYNKLIIGVKGLKNQRNYINSYYPEGYPIVEIDDDIDKIVELNTKTKTKTLKPIEDLDTFIKKAFEMCRKKKIFLWGVYPLANSHFMTEKVTTDLRFIVGPMWGMINRHHQDLVLTIDEKEDTERTLQHWVMDGKVLRFNNVGIETNYYKNKGGMQDEGKNRKEEALKSVYYLHKKYPELTKIDLGKKSGVPEIKLIK